MKQFQQNGIDVLWFKNTLESYAHRLSEIRLIISDIDSTLTDGNIYMFGNKDIKEIKGISMQDEFIIEKALEINLHCAFISGRESKTMRHYFSSLIPKKLYYDDCEKKAEAVKKIQHTTKILPKHTLFFGDDFLDIQTKHLTSMHACPMNAPFYIQALSDIVVPKAGGNSPFRLLLDLIMYSQNNHFAQQTIKKILEEKLR